MFGWIVFSAIAFCILLGNAKNSGMAWIVPIAWVLFYTLKAMKKMAIDKFRERADDKTWRKNLNREAERERVLGKARNEANIDLIKTNVEALIAQARAGAHIESELHAKRKELIDYENREFDDLVKKIDKYL